MHKTTTETYLRMSQAQFSQLTSLCLSGVTPGEDWMMEVVLTGEISIEVRRVPDTRIDFSKLSRRARNCLENARIETIPQLLESSPKKLRKMKNCGRKTIFEIRSFLKGEDIDLPREWQEERP